MAIVRLLWLGVCSPQTMNARPAPVKRSESIGSSRAAPASQGPPGGRRERPRVDVDPGLATPLRRDGHASIQALLHPFIRIEPPQGFTRIDRSDVSLDPSRA